MFNIVLLSLHDLLIRAYGVLLWEIFSFGKLPYEDQTNAEVMAKVMNGHRLGQPRLCPIQV